MPPPDTKGGPRLHPESPPSETQPPSNGNVSSPTVRHEADNRNPVDEMRLLVSTVDSQWRAIDAAHGTGYRHGFLDGFAAGQEVGYGRRAYEETQEWQAHKAMITGTADRPDDERKAALDRAYAAGEPCATYHPTGCSRCHRAAMVARRGADYQGGPAEWEPSEPAREVA
ncbi:hypothetical protein Aph01nite_34560 [Acrocarpospora phusangensis]|uniref:Uncharacterized protein n=1 Tax=Acrocarpospora phusangensis TaxID=1070424 RepID=A0A919QBU5_9ACTN|nr:hypothetical protein [Acrocarpospora phusangensis]GIH25146.1 hypothetical protein Aph01nite_34560 [Acrocarpospora phusangensis]